MPFDWWSYGHRNPAHPGNSTDRADPGVSAGRSLVCKKHLARSTLMVTQLDSVVAAGAPRPASPSSRAWDRTELTLAHPQKDPDHPPKCTDWYEVVGLDSEAAQDDESRNCEDRRERVE